MTYSIDFRACVIRNISSGMSWEDATRTFGVSRGTIARWLRHFSETGELADPPRKEYKTRKIDSQMLIDHIAAYPDATLAELSTHFDCWPQSIHKRCVKLGITRKKKQRSTQNEMRKSARYS